MITDVYAQTTLYSTGGVEEMKIEESGFCTDLVVGDKFDARLTGQSISASGMFLLGFHSDF